MAKQVINVGTSANDGTGDKIRVAFQKTNANFTELYDTKIESVVAGTNVTVDNTDPLNPIVSALGGSGSGTVTSVGLTMPSAFSVDNSPITNFGSLDVTAIGNASQYIRGDGTLATLPSGASGGSSISYYLNGGTAASVATYYQMSKIAVVGTGVDFSKAGNGLISQWLTDAADPNRLEIPAGNWNFEMYMSATSVGGTPAFYVELLKYDGTTFTTIANSSAVPEAITGGTSIDLYLTSLAIPQTTLLVTDRLAIRVYIVTSVGGRTITMHTQDSHLCQIVTNFAGGVTSLNGLTANTQNLAVGTSGSDFNISSVTDIHTFNLPDAGATKRGVITTGTQTIAGSKTFSSLLTMPSTGTPRILQVASSGEISGLDTGTYPSLTELATVRGITTGVTIQSQINSKQDALTAVNFGSFLNALANKTTPASSDTFSIRNNVNGEAEEVTYTNLSATLKAYFDTIYASSSNTFKRILNSTVETTPVTGTLTETLLYSAPVIAGGTFAFDDYFNFQMTFRKNGITETACTYRVKVSNTNNFATASLVATWQSQRFNTVIERKNLFFKANGTLNSGILTTAVSQTDLTNVTNAVTSLSVTPANDIYLFISVQLATITEDVRMTAIRLTN